MFKAYKDYTNYNIVFDDPEVFKTICKNEQCTSNCFNKTNTLANVLNSIEGVYCVMWEGTEDLFVNDDGYMYIDINNDVCHKETLKTVKKHITRFIDFWKGNENASTI